MTSRNSAQALTGRAKGGRKDGIQLSPERLKALREEKGLKQREVAEEVHRLMHPAPDVSPTSPESILSTYQEVESTGATSKKRAQKLAQLYKTSVAVLQGDFEAGESLGQRLAVQLAALVEAGASPALSARLDLLNGEGDHVQWLAEDLSHEIEQCQLTRIPGETERLSELTGWSPEELQNAGSQLGYWMLASGLGRPTQLTTGLQHAIQLLKEDFEPISDADAGLDIAFEEQLPWLRVTIRGRHILGRRGRALVQHMAGWPLANWRIRAGEAGISAMVDLVALPYQLLAGAAQRPPTLTIRLVEVLADGVRPAPWPHRSLQATAEKLCEDLAQVVAEVPTGRPRPPERERA